MGMGFGTDHLLFFAICSTSSGNTTGSQPKDWRLRQELLCSGRLRRALHNAKSSAGCREGKLGRDGPDDQMDKISYIYLYQQLIEDSDLAPDKSHFVKLKVAASLQ